MSASCAIGTVREVVGLKWPNGMALLDDNPALPLADPHQQLIACEVQTATTLTRRRMAQS